MRRDAKRAEEEKRKGLRNTHGGSHLEKETAKETERSHQLGKRKPRDCLRGQVRKY